MELFIRIFREVQHCRKDPSRGLAYALYRALGLGFRAPGLGVWASALTGKPESL